MAILELTKALVDVIDARTDYFRVLGEINRKSSSVEIAPPQEETKVESRTDMRGYRIDSRI